jgi:hypothetical protein
MEVAPTDSGTGTGATPHVAVDRDSALRVLETAMDALQRNNKASRLNFDWEEHFAALEMLQEMVEQESDEVALVAAEHKREHKRELQVALPGVARLRGCTVKVSPSSSSWCAPCSPSATSQQVTALAKALRTSWALRT